MKNQSTVTDKSTKNKSNKESTKSTKDNNDNDSVILNVYDAQYNSLNQQEKKVKII